MGAHVLGRRDSPLAKDLPCLIYHRRALSNELLIRAVTGTSFFPIWVLKIMAMSRIKGPSKWLAASLLICVSLVYGPSAALAQMTDSSGEQTELRPNTLRPSGQAPESQQSRTQEALPEASCSIRGFFHETWTEASQFGQGLKARSEE